MKILFDHCTPAPLRRYLTGHVIDTAGERGWSTLRNGVLLAQAEANGYDLLITTDQSIRHQQNFSQRRIALLLIMDNSWPRIRSNIITIQESISQTRPGHISIVDVPAIS